jgi:hypothetical protein
MQDRMLNRITDYWDQRVDAVDRLSEVLVENSEAETRAAMTSIVEAVWRHLNALDDRMLVMSAVLVIEDLYKAAIQLAALERRYLLYLAATAVPYFNGLYRRGYGVEYFIDNTFSRFDGPVLFLPTWFKSAGLIYICPQAAAIKLFEADRPKDEWPSLVAKYQEKGRASADLAAEQAHSAGRSYVYLDTDTPEDGFAVADMTRGRPGVIHVIRVEAPTPGSHCIVTDPPGPRASPEASAIRGASPKPPTEETRLAAPAAVVADPIRPGPSARDERPGLIKGLKTLFSRSERQTIDTTVIEQIVSQLTHSEEDIRRTARQALRVALADAASKAVDAKSRDALRAQVQAFRDAAWTLISQSKIADGEYTMVAAIESAQKAMAIAPELRMVMPMLLDARLKSFYTHPIAETNDAAYSALDYAINSALDAIRGQADFHSVLSTWRP